MTTENTKVIKSRIEDTSTADLWNFACLVVSLFCCFLILIGRSQKIDTLVSVRSWYKGFKKRLRAFLVALYDFCVVRGYISFRTDERLYYVLLHAYVPRVSFKFL